MAKFKAGDVVAYGNHSLKILHVGECCYFCINLNVELEQARQIINVDADYTLKKTTVKLYLYRYLIDTGWCKTSTYYKDDIEFCEDYDAFTMEKFHRIEESAWEPEE